MKRSIVPDAVDLEDVRQPPIESSRLHRDSHNSTLQPHELVETQPGHVTSRAPAILNVRLEKGLLDPKLCQAQRQIYYSFSQCINNEVPPHYRDFYINYDTCKEMIRHLSAANVAFQSGVNIGNEVPLKVKKLLDTTLQSLLVAHASNIDEKAVRQLCPQAVFSDMVREELNRVNQFGALKYNQIESEITGISRSLGKLIAIDKARSAENGGKDESECVVMRSPAMSVPTNNNASLKVNLSDYSKSVSGRGNTHSGVGQFVVTSDIGQNDVEISASAVVGRASDDGNDQTDIHSDLDYSRTSSKSIMSSSTSSPVSSLPTTHASIRSTILMPNEQFENWRKSELASIETSLDAMSAEIVHLDMFSRLNYKGFTRLTSIFDKIMKTTILPWTTANLIRELFANLDIDRLLIFMSVVWEKYRTALNRQYIKGKDTWAPPESFVRSTTKYWIRPHHVVKTKLSIVKHMPYLIFGCSIEDLEAFVDPFVTLTTPDPSSVHLPRNANEHACNPEESQLVSSIYFDSISAYSYGRRILRLEGAELVRFRWYGSNEGEDSKEIFIERKTHHEAWTGESSTKERFALPQHKVFDFMKGHLDIEEWAQSEATRTSKQITDKKYANMRRLGHEIQDLIIQKNLQPMVRTSYLRAAFQLSTSNDVRFSLDTNLCMVDELISDGHLGHPWCRLGEEVCGKEQVVRFPYAVLEVKLQAPQPPWVSNILADTEAEMVYKFSKFQHGMAFLHRSLVEHLGLPHWIPDFERQGYGAGFSGSQVFDLGCSSEEQRLNLGSPSSREIKSQKNSMVNRDNASNESRRSPLNWLWRRFRDTFFPWWHEDVPYFRYSNTDASIRDPRDISIHQRLYRIDSTASTALSNLLNQDDNYTPTGGGGALQSAKIMMDDKEGPKMTLSWMKSISEGLSKEDVMQLVYKRSKNVRKIDPKTYFAAERTFLHYLQKALYLAGLALAILSLGGPTSQATGVLLGSVSVLIIGYSFGIYERRCLKMNKRFTKARAEDKERLDSKWGPIVLFSVVAASILAAIAMNLLYSQMTISKTLTLPRHKHHLKKAYSTQLVDLKKVQTKILGSIRHKGIQGIASAVLGVGNYQEFFNK